RRFRSRFDKGLCAMSFPRACSRCERELPTDAPSGLCPACLLQLALDPGDSRGSALGDVDRSESSGPGGRREDRGPGTPSASGEVSIPGRRNGAPVCQPPGVPERVEIPHGESPEAPAYAPGVGRLTVPERLGDFRIVRFVAEGGMGYVYEAE